jgi:hypothetical protein
MNTTAASTTMSRMVLRHEATSLPAAREREATVWFALRKQHDCHVFVKVPGISTGSTTVSRVPGDDQMTSA